MKSPRLGFPYLDACSLRVRNEDLAELLCNIPLYLDDDSELITTNAHVCFSWKAIEQRCKNRGLYRLCS